MSSVTKKVLFGSAFVVCLILGLAIALHLRSAGTGITTIAFEKIEWDPQGHVRVTYRILADHGLDIVTEGRAGGMTWSGMQHIRRNPWPFASPVRTDVTEEYNLNPEGSREVEPCRKRLPVEIGKVYSVRPGERFFIYDFVAGNGDRHQRFIETKILR